MSEDLNKAAELEANKAAEKAKQESDNKGDEKAKADAKAKADKANKAAEKAAADAKKAEEEAEAAKKFIVQKEFRDINNFDKVHKAGSDVSNLDEDRLNRLVDLGIVSKE